MHLHPGLDEPRHRAAAAELAVVGVRREHEHALPGLDHAGSGSCGRYVLTSAIRPSSAHMVGSSKSAL